MFTLHFTPTAKSQLEEIKNKRPNKHKIICKVLGYLSLNPKHPSLNTHKFSKFPNFEDVEVFEAYAENNTPSAYRIFWYYGDLKQTIIIIAIIQHP